MSFGPLPFDGAHKFAALGDLAREAWAVIRGFPGRYQNVGENYSRFSWTGHRGAYDDWTPISNQNVDEFGVQYGIDPDTGTASASYAIPTMGYNRVRVFAIATGAEGQTLQVQAKIWKDEEANEAKKAVVLASGIPADTTLDFYDFEGYIGPWAQIKAVAEGSYELSAVTVTIHLWKE